MEKLVKLADVCPEILLEIVYATPHNFMGVAVYDRPACFLQKKCAERLKKVYVEANKLGLNLKVFDGYRPLFVQKKFWSFLPDARYVANPVKGSKHNRGAAVDLTLVDRQGKELCMPSCFDDFSEKSHRNYMGGSQEALENRQLLERLMLQQGFIGLETEWWHFDDPDWQMYPILDFSFDALEGL